MSPNCGPDLKDADYSTMKEPFTRWISMRGRRKRLKKTTAEVTRKTKSSVLTIGEINRGSVTISPHIFVILLLREFAMRRALENT